MHGSRLLALASLAAGCGAAVCPAPAKAEDPVWADANADGQVDVNDGVRIVRYQLADGPPPACRGQGDLLGTGDIAVEAAVHIWDSLFVGNATQMPAWDGCEVRYPEAEPPACGAAKIGPEAPDRVTAPSFEAEIRIRTEGLAPGPDAWSFGVVATGCTIADARLDGTAAATIFGDPPGIVEEGFTIATVVAGSAFTAVVPSWLEPVHLASDDADGQAVLALTVEADVPGSGCEPCTLAVTGDVAGPGGLVAAVVGLEGWTYAPDLGAVTVDVCAD